MKILAVLLTFVLYLKHASADVTGCDDVSQHVESEVQAELDATFAQAGSVTCGTDSITVTFDACILEKMGYLVDTDISVVGPSSTGGHPPGGVTAKCADATHTYTSGTGTNVYTIVFGLTECSTDVTATATEIVYTNAVRSISYANTGDGDAIHRFDIMVPFTCTYSSQGESLGEGEVQPSVAAITGASVDETGDYGVTVNLCEESTCDNSITSSSSVEVNDEAWLVISTAQDVNIMIKKVWATNENAGTGTDPLHTLVDADCPEDPSVTLSNNGLGESTLQFYWFYWTGTPTPADIFIHVQYTICDTGAGSCDDTTCPTRRRRSLLKDDRKVYSATFGPLKSGKQ